MRTEINVITYAIHDLADYINWIYFFHAWDFQPRFASIADIHGCDACRAQWLASFPASDIPKASEAMQLHKEAMRMLRQLDEVCQVKAVYRLMDAYGDGDDLILNGKRIPLLRQQTHIHTDDPYLCLSDFVRPRVYT